MENYVAIWIYFIIALFISAVMLIIPRFIAPSVHERHKKDTYECGFDQLSKPNQRFNVKFYLVAILFIIFDLEIAFLFPWAVVARDIGIEGFISVLVFLGILTVGFIYELVSGALDWD